MKTSLLYLYILCILTAFNLPLFAGGIDNRSNYSGEYVRSLNRAAANNSIDAIAYNPAGVMKLESGSHANFSVHYVGKDYTNIVDGERLEQDTPSLVPALFGMYKTDRWAAYFGFTIPAGGGEVDYDQGNATTRIGANALRNTLNAAAGTAVYSSIVNEKLHAEGFYYSLTVGGAYKLNDLISFSVAGRYIDAVKKVDATFQLLPNETGSFLGLPVRTTLLDYEDKSDGWGYILGLSFDFKPFYLSMKYESETDLDFEYTVNRDTITGLPVGLGALQGVINGSIHSRDLPALFSVGLAYTPAPKLRIDANFIYYFHEDAEWNGAENNVQDGWDAGITVEYAFLENLKGSVGWLHTQTGMDAQYALKEAPELDATTTGFGIIYDPSDNMRLDFGIGFVSYHGDSYTDTSSGSAIVIGLDKSVKMFSAGIEYKF